MAASRRSQGTAGEDLAVRFLEEEGFSILHRNYRYGHGEIDIVAKEGNELVFVEVKTRRSSTWGEPEEAVTPAKRLQIRRVAEGYFDEHDIDEYPCRFDVVAITFKNGKPEIRLIRDAF